MAEKIAYQSPREVATALLEGKLLDNRSVREDVKKAIIKAIIERDVFWKQELKRLCR